MGYLSNFAIGSALKDNGSYIEVSDNNTYPITLGTAKSRSDIGIAIFWSSDAFSSVLGGDLTNGNAWYIQSPENGTYTIRAFVVPVWSAGVWADHSIVYYLGNFYFNDTGAPTSNNPTLDGGDWTLMTTSDYQDFEDHLYTASVISYGYAVTEEVVNVSPYTIKRTDDHKYTIDFPASSEDKTMTITKYNGDPISINETRITPGNTSINIDLTNDGDSLYIIKFEERSVDDYEYVLYNLCDFMNCYNTLTHNIYKTGNNACMNNCNDEDQTLEICYRHELNKAIFYLTSIFGMINVESISYLNVYDIDQDRSSFINKVGEYVDKLAVITADCDGCS